MEGQAQARVDAVDAAHGLRSFDWRPRYSTSREDLVADFFEPALDRAARYDRAVGYFRSSFYSLTGVATARFALRGGRIRLLCSPELTEEDVTAIQEGLDQRAALDTAVRRELEQILRYPSVRKPFELLANLIAINALDVRFAIWNERAGLFHDKVGIFFDSLGDSISFSGSINETWRAWHPLGNHESFEVFLSWTSERSRVSDHQAYFEALWDGREPGVSIYEAPEAFREGFLRYADRDPEEKLRTIARTPMRQPKRLFDHQSAALGDWEKRGRRGILDHATGSGKTLTALNAIRGWIGEGKPALVVVPSQLLLEQWADEAAAELDELGPSIVLVGGGHDTWRRDSLLRLQTRPTGGARLTIATVQTACTPAFLSRVDQGPHLLVVADEAHRFGSSEFRAVFGIDAGARLGLSATPQRAGDPEGTRAIFDYFGDILEPRFTLRDGIEANRLCPYEYFIHLVQLDHEELEEWKALSVRIAEAYAREQGADRSAPLSEQLKFLLIQRARIAKKAHAKVPTACKIVGENFVEGQHWLLYCDDQAQLRAVLDRLRRKNLDALEYHAAMGGDRGATLDRYRRFGGILVAIRCLDEGVDIPAITHAVILASSRNPREFIQRRGRLLRKAEGKFGAVIHDLLVAPPDDPEERLDGLLRAEIARAREFAESAINRSTETELDGLCIEWGIDQDEIKHFGVEED
jgi:superfamily II DNA or RNA helicase